MSLKDFAGALRFKRDFARRHARGRPYYALEDVIGLWHLITPYTMHIEGEQARELAGRGMVYMGGFKP